MSSGAGSSGTGRGRGSSLADNKPENKEAKPNPKMSKALGTSAKRYFNSHYIFIFTFLLRKNVQNLKIFTSEEDIFNFLFYFVMLKFQFSTFFNISILKEDLL